MPRQTVSPRPLSRAQVVENRAFLRHLRVGGNARAAARAVGKAYSTMQHRRGHHPSFALDWDIAVVVAHARLVKRGGVRGPVARAAGPEGHRTVGGEPTVVRLKSGKLQVRAAHPDKLTKSCEQAFLLALSATANVRLSAAAAGAAEGAFLRRKRRDRAFAREWKAALARGYERLEGALAAGFAHGAHAHDAWAHNDPPAIPPMTAAQALQLLYLHQKEARLLDEPGWARKRRGEPGEIWSLRMAAVSEARLEAEREKFRVAEAARRAGDGLAPGEAAVVLPDLGQVEASKADPAKVAHDGERALFGGWRMGHLAARRKSNGRD